MTSDTADSAESAEEPIDRVVASALRDLLFGAAVEIIRTPAGSDPPGERDTFGSASAQATDATGTTTVSIRLDWRVARLLENTQSFLAELLAVLPDAGLRAAMQLRDAVGRTTRATPAVRRAVRDTVAAEILASYLTARLRSPLASDFIPETIDYLIELSGTRVEAHHLTHGVVVTDVLHDEPRIELRYPDDLRAAKRAPLLFDGQQSVLIVDPDGRARTELERHRFDRLGGRPPRLADEGWLDSGSLIALATKTLGGVGFYVRSDRSIWTFVEGQPLLVRRGEHWTAFPVELAASIANMIGGGRAADLVARAAFMISARPQGAILAIVDGPASVDDVVSVKDRYDLRNEIDPTAMRPETRLHHLIDAEEINEHTVARLAGLDGATIVDREGGLIAYGAIVSSADSEHEGARTAAARTLSENALVVLKVSVDGDITIFREGAAVSTLLGRPPE